VTTGQARAIVDVRSYPLCYPEPHDGGRLRHICVVRVESASGHVGWGEAITGLPEASRAVELVVEQGLAPLLAGEDPAQIERHLDRMQTHTFWYGTGGIATLAISAIDTALWDLRGRIEGVPVHELLGGKLADRVRVCASVIWDVEDLAGTAEWCRSFVARGYTAMKAGWGRRPDAAFGLDPERDVELVRTVREAIGPDVEFAADVSVHARWSLEHAIEMAGRLAPFDLAWLEDALPFDDFAGFARLRAAAPMAIATGERLWRPNEYRQLFDAQAADIVLIDPGRVEGISGMKATAELAARAGVQFVPHSWSSAINTAAALHVFASSANGRIFELKPDPSPMQHELVADPFTMEDGYLAVPDSPGLGVEVDEDVLTEYRLR
jgi:L-alanine-DL-glutamate epimerase-like enolase superfamily enzyme